MSDLNIKEMKEYEAKNLSRNFDITLKRDGTLIYFRDGKLYSPRCERSQRYPHILKLLLDNNFPMCYGEMYIDDGNVFDISRRENWNKAKFMIIDINERGTLKERQKIISEMIAKINSPSITEMVRFDNFTDGWDYVKKNNQEGLVLRNDCEWYKVKILQEAKVPIKEHETGRDKGTFILEDGNRISGTSASFVIQFLDIQKRGNTPIAEIEFPFKTKEGHYFQPRLRRIFTEDRRGEIENE